MYFAKYGGFAPTDLERRRMTEAAMAEVEAIERAAKGWWGEESRRHSMMSPEEKATLETIAKEAP